MKKLLILLLLIICGFTYWYYRLPNVVKRVRPSVVYVEAWGMYGQRWFGSGMVVGDGLIMTAAHVVRDANDVRITFDDGTKIRSSEFFQLNRDDVIVDAGLIIFDGDDDHLHFTQFKPLSGATVFTVGSPFGLQNSVAIGVFSTHNVYIQNEQLYQLDINGAPGMSGCPVFNRYGMIIGILVRGNCSGIAFIVPARICQAVVNIYENVQRIKTK